MIESYIPGPLAQLAEQGPFKPLVTGSSPVRLTPGVTILNTLHSMIKTVPCSQSVIFA